MRGEADLSDRRGRWPRAIGAGAVIVVAALALALTLAVGLSTGSGATSPRKAGAATNPPASKGIPVEIVLTARRAHWRPGPRGQHRLILDRVAPRMAMMATAPRREVAFVPASMLATNWKPLFHSTGGVTNAVLSAPVRGRPTLFALQLKFIRERRGGTHLEFAVSHLRATAHDAVLLGGRARTLHEPTVLIDPLITDAVRAMWEALVRTFSGQDFERLPNPTFPSPDGGRIFDNGEDSPLFDGAVYKGPMDPTSIDGEAAWRRVQQANIDGAFAGSSMQAITGDEPNVSVIAGGKYSGLALFNHEFGTISLEAKVAGRIELTDAAFFEIDARAVVMDRVDLGNANMRGMEAGTFTVTNSLFESVDMTGANIGSEFREGQRNKVENAAFIDVVAFREVTDANGTPDRGTEELRRGEPLQLRNIDFKSVTFQNVDFRNADVSSGTFSGCGMLDVNFSGADFRGLDPRVNDGRLQNTFEDSILEHVNFAEAKMDNVSFDRAEIRGAAPSQNGGRFEPGFRGAELTNARFEGARMENVSFDGAVIRGPSPAENGARFVPTFNDATLRNVSFEGARLENVSFAGVDVSRISLEGATLVNVDFTGAIGRQLIEWNTVNVEGNVYGVAEYAQQIRPENPNFIRSMTFDGVVPAIDAETGYDVEPGYTDRFIDPDTGVRLERTSAGLFEPIDATGQRLRDPASGTELTWEGERLVNPEEPAVEFDVDRETGEVSRR